MSSEPIPSSRVLRGRRKVQDTATSVPQPPVEASTSQDTIATGSKTSRKRKNSSAGSSVGATKLGLEQDISQRLDNVGVPVGPKTCRVRLIELLDQYTKTKKPRVEKTTSGSRIPSAHVTRSKFDSKKATQDEGSLAQISNTQDPSADLKPAPPDHDFSTHETSELINMIERVGLYGQGLKKDELVGLCNEYRDLIVIPQHFFRFTLPEPRSQSPPRLQAIPESHNTIKSVTAESQSSEVLGRQGAHTQSAESSVPSQTLPEQVSTTPETQLIHPKKNTRKGKQKADKTSDLPQPKTSLSVQDGNPLRSAIQKEQPAESSVQPHNSAVQASTLPEAQLIHPNKSTRKGKQKADITSQPNSSLSVQDGNPLKSAIRKETRKGKSRAISPPHVSFQVPHPETQSTLIPSEQEKIAEPGTSANRTIEGETRQSSLPSFEHTKSSEPSSTSTQKSRRTRKPVTPALCLRPKIQTQMDISDEDMSPTEENNSYTSSYSDEMIIDSDEDDSDEYNQSPGPQPTRKRPARGRASTPPSTHLPSSTAEMSPNPDIDESPVHDSIPKKEANNDSEWRTKFYQVKHSLDETNHRLDLVVQELKVLSQVVNTLTEAKPSAPPPKKIRGGRSALWMRLHVDTLLGRRPNETRLPAAATEQDRQAWKFDTNLDTLDACLLPSGQASTTSDPHFPYTNGPGHPKATSQQLAVMWTMMQAVGVSSFRPDFDKSLNASENKWLWDLAFRIFIKLVECNEYSGVSLTEENIPALKNTLVTRVRSLTKAHKQEVWDDDRKKRAARAVRRHARLRYLKKLRERVVLSKPPLWPLTAILPVACSDDETDHESCVNTENNESQCHIRKLTWRSVELTNTLALLDEYKARLDASNLKPRNSPSENQSSPNNGRPSRPRIRCSNPIISEDPAPSGLPIDCYSPQYLATLTPLEKCALEIDRTPILSKLPIVESLK